MLSTTCSLGVRLLGTTLAAAVPAAAGSLSSAATPSSLLLFPADHHHHHHHDHDHHHHNHLSAAARSSSSSSSDNSGGGVSDSIEILRKTQPPGKKLWYKDKNPRRWIENGADIDFTVLSNESLPGQFCWQDDRVTLRVYPDSSHAGYYHDCTGIPAICRVPCYAKCTDLEGPRTEFWAHSESARASDGCIPEVIGAFKCQTHDFMMHMECGYYPIWEKARRWSAAEKLHACQRLAKAVAAVRAAGWVHGAVSWETVNCYARRKEEERADDPSKVALTDFSWARKRQDANKQYLSELLARQSPELATDRPSYYAFCTDHDRHDDDDEDVHALGKVFMELVCSELERRENRPTDVRMADSKDMIHRLPPRVRRLVERCLTPQGGITPQEIVDELATMTPADLELSPSESTTTPTTTPTTTTTTTDGGEQPKRKSASSSSSPPPVSSGPPPRNASLSRQPSTRKSSLGKRVKRVLSEIWKK